MSPSSPPHPKCPSGWRREVTSGSRAYSSADASRSAAAVNPATWIPPPLICCIYPRAGGPAGLRQRSRAGWEPRPERAEETIPPEPHTDRPPYGKPRARRPNLGVPCRPRPGAESSLRWGPRVPGPHPRRNSVPRLGGSAEKDLSTDSEWAHGPGAELRVPLGCSGPDPRPLSQTDSARPDRVRAEAANPTCRGNALAAVLYF